jgi:hypothetical protein
MYFGLRETNISILSEAVNFDVRRYFIPTLNIYTMKSKCFMSKCNPV